MEIDEPETQLARESRLLKRELLELVRLLREEGPLELSAAADRLERRMELPLGELIAWADRRDQEAEPRGPANQ